jgi:hypothetical protein
LTNFKLYLFFTALLYIISATPSDANNLYSNSSFEIGLSPALSSGENHLLKGPSKFGKYHAMSMVQILSFAAVPVPEGATIVTFSVYLRAENPAPIRLGMRGNSFSGWEWSKKEGADVVWRRYHITKPLNITQMKVSEDERPFVAPFIMNKKNIMLHVDGVQIEFNNLTRYTPQNGVSTGAWTGEYGNVFSDSLPVKFNAGIENNTDRPLSGQWRINIKNQKGVQVFYKIIDVSLEPGALFYKQFSLVDLPFGHYILKAAIISGQREITIRRMTFCRIEAREDLLSEHFGLHSRYVNEADSIITKKRWKLIGNVGAGWIRIFCSWAFVESERGKYKWQYYDSEIDSAIAKGMKVLAVFYNRAPKWASGGDDGIGTLDLAAFIAERMSFRRAFIERYTDKVEAWELFNEPYWFYSADKKRGIGQKFLMDYFQVHKKTYEYVKELDPTAQTVGNLGAFFLRESDYTFLKAVADAGLLEYMDVLSLHDYRYKMSSKQLQKKYAKSLKIVRQVLTENDKFEMPIWQTESAVRSDDLMDPHTVFYERPRWMLKDFIGEWQAACNYAKAIFFRIGGGVSKDFYFNFSQSGIKEPLLAVFRNRWEEPKVIYPVQCTITNMIGDAGFTADVNDSDNGLEAYLFKSESKVVAAFWSVKASGNILKMDTEGLFCKELILSDLMGNGLTLTMGTNLMLPLSSEPHFIQCKTGEPTPDSKLMIVRLRNAQILAK